jgi:hypothetical protein
MTPISRSAKVATVMVVGVLEAQNAQLMLYVSMTATPHI